MNTIKYVNLRYFSCSLFLFFLNYMWILTLITVHPKSILALTGHLDAT